MSEKKIGFGIIGTGAIAAHHAEAIKAFEKSELIAVCSSTKERAIKAEEKFGVKAYYNIQDLLSLKEIDVVCICTESGNHLEPGLAVAKAGKHILLEKPIEISLDRADQLIQYCAQEGVKLGVIFQNRFKSGYISLRKALNERAFGKLIMATAAINWYRDPSYYNTSDWKGTIKGDGGAALINQGIHTIDLLLDVMGEVDTVYGKVKTVVHQIEGEDVGAAVINFRNGAIGTITGGTALYPGYPERLEVYGENGSVVMEGGKIVTWNLKGEKSEGIKSSETEGTGSSDPMAIDFKLHMAQIADMVEAILEDRSPIVDGKTARRSLELILGIYRSSKEEKPISLSGFR